MKLIQNFSILACLPLALFHHGQYRGPEYEALIQPVDPTRPAPTQPGGFTNSALTESFERWEFWFEMNKDVLLRSRRATRVNVLGPKAAAVIGADRVNAEIVEKEILPLLKTAAAGKDQHLVYAAIHAMGKLGNKEAYDALETLATKGSLETQKLVAMAMGTVDERKGLVLLMNLLDSKDSAADLRAYAAMGIGLRGTPETVSILKSFLERNLNVGNAGGEMRNVIVAAITALGMTRDAAGVTLLVQKYHALDTESHSRSRAVLSAIVTALGRIGDGGALGTLLEALASDDIDLRRAAALALGDLADAGAVEGLTKVFNSDGDMQARGFAGIGLGRIGGQKARDVLREGLGSKKNRTIRAYSAIGLGLAGDEASAENLRKLFTSTEDESMRGAAAIGLGFLRDSASVQPLIESVESRATPARLRGYAAIALGLIRPDGILPRMLTVMRDDSDRQEDFQRGILLGVGMFRDPVATPDLLKILADDKRDMIRGYAALAVGMTRDKNAIKPLGDLLAGKGKAQPEAPVYAAIALGALGDRYSYPLFAECFFNMNYRMRVEVVDKIVEIF